jgi:hypothetical protein
VKSPSDNSRATVSLRDSLVFRAGHSVFSENSGWDPVGTQRPWARPLVQESHRRTSPSLRLRGPACHKKQLYVLSWDLVPLHHTKQAYFLLQLLWVKREVSRVSRSF